VPENLLFILIADARARHEEPGSVFAGFSQLKDENK
jgi:hypothetical protein